MVFVTKQNIVYMAREYKIPVVRIELEGNHNNTILNDIEFEQLFASTDIIRSINIINGYLDMLDVFINQISDETTE